MEKGTNLIISQPFVTKVIFPWSYSVPWLEPQHFMPAPVCGGPLRTDRAGIDSYCILAAHDLVL